MLSDEEMVLVDEGLKVLTQGVEMMHYDISASETQKRKVVWVDPKIHRICVYFTKPEEDDKNKDIEKGKVSPGIYFRDLSEVRLGRGCFDFMEDADPPENEDQCLALIGTERTICLELPSKFSRDWFAERFELIAKSVLTDAEKSLRERLKWTTNLNHKDPENGVSVSPQMIQLLTKGIRVMHHHPNGKAVLADLIFLEESSRFEVAPVEKDGVFSKKNIGLQLGDITEIRPGTHALGFIRTDSSERQAECMSLIGSENCIDIQVPTNKGRDMLLHKLVLFVESWGR